MPHTPDNQKPQSPFGEKEQRGASPETSVEETADLRAMMEIVQAGLEESRLTAEKTARIAEQLPAAAAEHGGEISPAEAAQSAANTEQAKAFAAGEAATLKRTVDAFKAVGLDFEKNVKEPAVETAAGASGTELASARGDRAEKTPSGPVTALRVEIAQMEAKFVGMDKGFDKLRFSGKIVKKKGELQAYLERQAQEEARRQPQAATKEAEVKLPPQPAAKLVGQSKPREAVVVDAAKRKTEAVIVGVASVPVSKEVPSEPVQPTRLQPVEEKPSAVVDEAKPPVTGAQVEKKPAKVKPANRTVERIEGRKAELAEKAKAADGAAKDKIAADIVELQRMIDKIEGRVPEPPQTKAPSKEARAEPPRSTLRQAIQAEKLAVLRQMIDKIEGRVPEPVPPQTKAPSKEARAEPPRSTLRQAIQAEKLAVLRQMIDKIEGRVPEPVPPQIKAPPKEAKAEPPRLTLRQAVRREENDMSTPGPGPKTIQPAGDDGFDEMRRQARQAARANRPVEPVRPESVPLPERAKVKLPVVPAEAAATVAGREAPTHQRSVIIDESKLPGVEYYDAAGNRTDAHGNLLKQSQVNQPRREKPPAAAVKPEAEKPEVAPTVVRMKEAGAILSGLEARLSKEFGGLAVVKLVRRGGREAKAKLEAEIAAARQEYGEIRAEAVGGNVDRIIAEGGRQAAARLQEIAKEKRFDQKFIGRANDLYKKLGDLNVLALVRRMGGQKLEAWNPTTLKGKVATTIGQFVCRSMSVRSAINLGLLGIGIYAGASLSIGLMTLGGRRLLSGASTAFGSYDAMKSSNERKEAKISESQLAKMDKIEIITRLEGLEAKALIAGQEPGVDPIYQKLRARLGEVMGGAQFGETEAKQLAAAEAEGRSKTLLEQVDEQFETMQRKSARHNAVMIGLAVTLGALVGGGAVAEAFGNVKKLAGLKPSAAGAVAAEPGRGSHVITLDKHGNVRGPDVSSAPPPKFEQLYGREILAASEIHRGDGYTQIFERVLKAKAHDYGYNPAQDGSLDQWASRLSVQIARENHLLSARSEMRLDFNPKHPGHILLEKQGGHFRVVKSGQVLDRVFRRPEVLPPKASVGIEHATAPAPQGLGAEQAPHQGLYRSMHQAIKEAEQQSQVAAKVEALHGAPSHVQAIESGIGAEHATASVPHKGLFQSMHEAIVSAEHSEQFKFAGGNSKFSFKYDTSGRVTGIAVEGKPDLAAAERASRRMLQNWENLRQSGRAADVVHGRDIIENEARGLYIRREALNVLKVAGRGTSPEAAFLRRGIDESLQQLKQRFGGIFKKQ